MSDNDQNANAALPPEPPLAAAPPASATKMFMPPGIGGKPADSQPASVPASPAQTSPLIRRQQREARRQQEDQALAAAAGQQGTDGEDDLPPGVEGLTALMGRGRRQPAEEQDDTGDETPRELDDDLLARAERAGMDRQMVEGLGPQAGRYLDLLESRQRATAQPTPQTPPPPAPMTPKPQSFAFQWAKDEDGRPRVSEDISRNLEGFAKHQQDTIGALQRQVGDLNDRMVIRDVAEQVAQTDFAPFVRTAADARDLAVEMTAVQLAAQMRGQQIGPDQALQRACRSLYGDRLAKRAQQQQRAATQPRNPDNARFETGSQPTPILSRDQQARDAIRRFEQKRLT